MLCLLVLPEPIFSWHSEARNEKATELFETLDLQPKREPRQQEEIFYLNRP